MPFLRTTVFLVALFFTGSATQAQQPATYSSNELINAGHHFFGTVSHDLALAIEHAFSKWGQPNGYILGQEGSGAIAVGLRYGEGTLYTRNAGNMNVFWQGPSLGIDVGVDGARTMMLVYKMPRVRCHFYAFRWHFRLCLFGRRLWRDSPYHGRYGRGANPLGRWPAARS